MSQTVDRPMPKALERAYAMKAREDQDGPEVIAAIFSLYDIEMHALICPCSTHSYVCIERVFDKITSLQRLLYDMHVTSRLEQSVNVNRVYKNYSIVIHDREFSADLIALSFHEFDLILGMDWLSKHGAIIEVIVHDVCFGPMSNVILAKQAWRFLRKGCEAFLALVLNSKKKDK